MRRDKSSRLHSRKSSSRKKRGTYARQFAFEALEGRRVLATSATFNPVTGVLLIDMPAAADDATISLVAGDYEVRDQADALVPIAGGPANPGNVKRLEVTAIAAGNNDFVLNATINPISGIDTDDDVDSFTINADITGVDTGQAVDIVAPVINLNANITTDGGHVILNGPVVLGAAAQIDTDFVGGTSKDAGSVSIASVDGAFDLQIDATTDDNATAGLIQFGDIGSIARLTKFEAITEDRIQFAGAGNAILTDGGDVRLIADTFELANVLTSDYLIDTETGGDNPGGAVDLGGVGFIRNTGAGIPAVLRIDSRGTTKGAVTLPSSGQFVQGAPTPGFANYNDALFSAVRIQVATQQLFFENFALPTAAARFSSTNFSQVGNQFVASPPNGKKAVATILPAQITPAPPLPTTYSVSATTTLTQTSGRFKNGFIVFDAVDNKNFKFAGVFKGRGRFSIGEVKNGSVIHKRTSPIAPGLTFNLSVDVDTTTGAVTLSNNGSAVVNFNFGTALSPARLPGVGTNNAITNFTNISLTG